MKKYLLISSLILICLVATGCTTGTMISEQGAVEENQDLLSKAVTLPQLDHSLERENIKKRLETFNEANKLTYIYLINFGKVMSFHTVKGKITSGNKRLTPSQRLVDEYGCTLGSDESCSIGSTILDAPELDGTYGSSAPYIYFWTTEGAYVQWSGDYMLSDQPLKLTTQPELIREIK